jgi:hypothetical protein
MPDYEAFTANRVKHLEMIQSVVARLAGNSFLVKGWALTVALALFGFAIDAKSASLAIIGLLALLPFFALDAYFLQAERLFRVLYDEVRAPDSKVEPFFLGATTREFRKAMTQKGKDVSWQATTWRPTLLVFYGGLVVAGLFAANVAG